MATKAASEPTKSGRYLGRNFHHLPRVQVLQKLPRALWTKFGIRRLDAQEKLVSRGTRELCHVEYRMIRLRQPIERQHSYHGRDARNQNHQFESDGDVCGPGIQRSSGNVVRISD